jgi:tetratricopeptide (TPR) repeat protein
MKRSITRPARRPLLPRALRILFLGVVLTACAAVAWRLGVVRPARLRADAELQAVIEQARDALQAGQPERARRLVAAAPESGPRAADVLTIKGMAQAARQQPDDARSSLERSLAINPAQPMALKVLAAICFSDEELDKGLALLARAAALDPDDFRPWYASGDILLRYRNKPREAVRFFQEAIRRRPEDTDSRIGLASAMLTLGEVEASTPVVDGLLREATDDPSVLRLAAIRARLLAQHADAERFAGQALRHDPDNVEVLIVRAQSRLESGRREDALADAEHAAALVPHNPTVLYRLASIENAVGLKQRAAATTRRYQEVLAIAGQIDQLQKETRKNPEDIESHWRLGEAAAQAGRASLARKSFRAALALDPGCIPARTGLAALDRLANAPR